MAFVRMLFWLTVLVLCLLLGGTSGATSLPSCHELDRELKAFGADLDGYLVTKGSVEYDNATFYGNLDLAKHPWAIIFPSSIGDVQKTVLFAQEHNIRLSVRSSGHSFVGRSTADDSLQINFAKMKKILVNTNDPSSDTGASALVETGSTWADIYKEVHKYGLLAVGGSAHTVAVGGYTLGGGHSPITRSLGLGVDSVLEITMVTGNGSIVVSTATGTTLTLADGSKSTTSNSELFWALRGGGGVFGVVTSIKIKLHQPPTGFVHMWALIPMRLQGVGNVGEQFINFYTQLLKNEMSDKWGGYLLTNNRPTPVTPGSSQTIDGLLTLSLLHFGPWEDAVDIVNKISSWNPALSKTGASNVSTFWDYEKDVDDPYGLYLYIFNRLIRPEDLGPAFSKMLGSDIMDSQAPAYCTGAHVGGQRSRNPPVPAAVTDRLRTGVMSLTCSTVWDNNVSGQKSWVIENIQDFKASLYKFGDGVYYNEPDYYLQNWQSEFWGENNERLLRIKRQWDPDNMFTCHMCVGSRDREDSTAPCTGHAIETKMSIFIVLVIVLLGNWC